eukprot:2438486-Lingulodinium_polyedra.AAC.1
MYGCARGSSIASRGAFGDVSRTAGQRNTAACLSTELGFVAPQQPSCFAREWAMVNAVTSMRP